MAVLPDDGTGPLADGTALPDEPIPFVIPIGDATGPADPVAPTETGVSAEGDDTVDAGVADVDGTEAAGVTGVTGVGVSADTVTNGAPHARQNRASPSFRTPHCAQNTTPATPNPFPRACHHRHPPCPQSTALCATAIETPAAELAVMRSAVSAPARPGPGHGSCGRARRRPRSCRVCHG